MLTRLPVVRTDTALRLAYVRSLAKSGRARELRQQARLSLAEVGAVAGVDQASVWRWETGRRAPQGAPALRYETLLRSLEEVGRASA